MNVPILSRRREAQRLTIERQAAKMAIAAVEKTIAEAGTIEKSFLTGNAALGNTGMGGAATMMSSASSSGAKHPGTSWSNTGGTSSGLIARVTQNLASGFERAPEELELALAEQGLCYSDDTEVLTDTGWKRFVNVDITVDRFATRNPQAKTFEWQRATHFHHYSPESMYHFMGKGLDLLVTGKHRMLLAEQASRGQWFDTEWTAAEVHAELGEDVPSGARWRIPQTSEWEGTELETIRFGKDRLAARCVVCDYERVHCDDRCSTCYNYREHHGGRDRHDELIATAPRRMGRGARPVVGMPKRRGCGNRGNPIELSGDDFAAFMGAWLAEGSLKSTDKVSLAQYPETKGWEPYRQLLERVLGRIPYHDGRSWEIGSVALHRYLKQFGHARTKFIPDEIKNLSRRQLAIFWEFYRLGDGHTEASGRTRIVTASQRMAGDLQEIAQKMGFSASVRPLKPPTRPSMIRGREVRATGAIFVITLRERRAIGFRVKRVASCGDVYCVSVPNETLYVRRDGFPAWCKNSWGPPFPPGRPLDPFYGYRRAPRTQDYPVGTNVQITPRANRISYATLHAIHEAYDVAQICTKHLTNDVRSLDYNWEPIPGIKADVSEDIEQAIAFFDSPDKRQPFRTWLAEWLQDVLRYDAGTLYIRRNEAGDPIALEVIDGTTILPLVDFYGRRPVDEDDTEEPEGLFEGEITPAFVQIIQGLPWDWLANEDIIYLPWNPTPESQYGRAPLEAVLLSANCFAADTEVLTRRGWLTFPEVDIAKDEIATRHPETQALEWQQATKFYEAPYDGPLYHFTAKSVDMLVTAGHRMLVDHRPKNCPSAERWGDGWRIQAEDLARVPYSTGTKMLLTSEWDAPDLGTFQLTPEHPNKKSFTELSGDDFAAFMGMWLAEGSCAYEPGARNDIWVSQLPSSKGFAAYSALLERLLSEPCRHDGKRFVFHNSALASYLKQFGGATEKYVPDEILNLSQRQLKLFWEHYFLGDGCDRGSVPTITTSSKRMADHLQEVAQKVGRAASVRQLAPAAPGRMYQGRLMRENAPRWQVTLTSATTRRFRVERVDDHDNDTVYCVSVPNRVIYVRRNGHALWCGQTDIRFQWHFLNFFTEGTVPAGFMEAPPDASDPAQIATWQETWDAVMQGDQTKLRQIRWVPNGSKFTESKPASNTFDELFPLYLMRRTTAAFGVTPNDLGFTESVNRATGDTQIDVQFRVGTSPLLRYAEDIINLFAKQHLKLRCRLRFDDGKETEDRVATATADGIYLDHAVKGVDEVRQELGLHVDKSRPMPRYVNNARSGPIPLLALESMAGQIDPETYGPSDAQKPVDTPFSPAPGAIAPQGSPEQKAAAEHTAQNARDLQAATAGEPLSSGAEGEDEAVEAAGGEEGAAEKGFDWGTALRLMDEYDALKGVNPTTITGGTDGITVPLGIQGEDLLDDDEDEEDDVVKQAYVALALRRWRSNSRNRLKKGRAPRRFVDPNMPAGLHDEVWASLAKAKSRAEVDAAFAAVGKAPAGVRPAAKFSPQAKQALKAGRPPFHAQADKIVEHYAPVIAGELGGLFDQDALDTAFRAAEAAKGSVEKSAGPPPNLRDAETSIDDQAEKAASQDPARAAAIKALQAKMGSPEALEATLRELYGDSFLQGAHDAAHAAGGTIVASLKDVSESPPATYWNEWKPGYGGAAAKAADGGMRDMLDQAGLTIQGLTDTSIDRIGGMVSEGLAKGDSIQTVGKEIRDVIEDSERADMIANTEMNRASTEASVETYKENEVAEVEWLAEADACPECEAEAAASPYPLDGGEQPPAHPNCFPAGTVVSGPAVRATTMRQYEGDLVTVVLESGKQFAVTPNHPILTRTGWCAAGDLDESCDVLSALEPERIALLVNPDDYQAVARIEDVAGASREALGMTTRRVPMTAEDLHGDGTLGEYVDVVSPTGGSKLALDIEEAEQVGEQGLVGAKDTALLSGRRFEPLSVAHDASSRRRVGSLSEFQAFIGSHACHARKHRFAAVPVGDTSLAQHPIYSGALNAVTESEGLDGLTGEEVRDEVGGLRGASRASRDVTSFQRAPEDTLADAGNGSALAQRLAGLVQLDRVVNIRRVESSGHVFNLETVDGWYCANGVIAHNCRCALAPVVDLGSSDSGEPGE